MRCVLIASGEYHFDYVPKDEFIIAVDGGYDYLVKQNIKPHLVVGDLDSVTSEIKDTEIIKYKKEKDETDLYLAIKEAIKRGFKNMIVFGALGKRLEHTLANIQLLKYFEDYSIVYINQNMACFIVRENEIYEIDKKKGLISIFSLTSDANISISGLKYELNNQTINSSFPLGIDNEAIGKNASITVSSGIILVITRFNN